MSEGLQDRVLEFLVREEWRGFPGDVARSGEVALSGDRPAAEALLVGAAAALSCGEPKRARRLLEPTLGLDEELGALGHALAYVGAVLDQDWEPGGRLPPSNCRTDTEGEQYSWRRRKSAPHPSSIVFEVVGEAPSLRRRATFPLSSGREGWAQEMHEERAKETHAGVHSHADRVLDDATATAIPRIIGPAALLGADLYARTGKRRVAEDRLAVALNAYREVDDSVGVAACELTEGDWWMDPSAHPDMLGENTDSPAAYVRLVDVSGRDLALAAKRYADAAALYRAAGVTRGLAAVRLRQARLAALSQDLDAALAYVSDACAAAEAADDGALMRLARVHRGLLQIERDGVGRDAELGPAVGEWAATDGSTSFGRGLARLCHVKALVWKEADQLGRARAALAIAEAIYGVIGDGMDTAHAALTSVEAEQVRLYDSANYERATLALVLLDLAEARERGAPLEDLQWATLSVRAIRASAAATALDDSAARERLLGHRRWLLRRAPQAPEREMYRTGLADTIADDEIAGLRRQGFTARAEQRTDDAAEYFARALKAAGRRGPRGIEMVANVLRDMRRYDELVELMEPLARAGEVHPISLAGDFVKAGRFDLARWALDSPNVEEATPSQRPWRLPAERAQALLDIGDAAAALPFAETAVALFEDHLARLSRDVLRAMASDDRTAVRLYTTAVLAHAELATGDSGSDRGHLATSFELSDRCRGSALTDILNRDEMTGSTPSVMSAIRDWHRAGAALARAIEHLDDTQVSTVRGKTRRAEMQAAERNLDAAEVALAAKAPSLFAGRRRLARTPSLSEIQSQLAPGTLLLQYHAFETNVVVWAVSRDRVRMSKREHASGRLAAEVRRFHQTVSDVHSTKAQRDALAAPLADLLLKPVEPELDAYQRIVIVPHRMLAMLPFHLLPHGGRHLGATHVVSYLPASSILQGRPKDEHMAFGNALVLGNPIYERSRGLTQLPGAGTEAMAIAALRGVNPFVEHAAQRDDVLAALAEAEIVHLATHGSLVPGAPYSAELALAGTDSLTVPDLVGTETRLRLAVLSACDSGRGHATASGDLIGMTRALIGAGARELIVSLWPVDDQIACLTMVKFHEALQISRPPDALASAQQAVRALTRADADAEYAELQTRTGTSGVGPRRSARDLAPGPYAMGHEAGDPSHPFFWAPFVHIGV